MATNKPDTYPYEFLVRWRGGKLSGAHIQYIEHYPDGHFNLLPPQPVEEGGKFPLATILGDLHIAALAKIQKLEDELKAAKAKLDVQSA